MSREGIGCGRCGVEQGEAWVGSRLRQPRWGGWESASAREAALPVAPWCSIKFRVDLNRLRGAYFGNAKLQLI